VEDAADACFLFDLGGIEDEAQGCGEEDEDGDECKYGVEEDHLGELSGRGLRIRSDRMRYGGG